jgi:hypothetical protein
MMIAMMSHTVLVLGKARDCFRGVVAKFTAVSALALRPFTTRA